MNFEEFCKRVVDGKMRLWDIPILAAIILAAVVVVIGEIGCAIWFFIIMIHAICNGAAELLMLVPCVIIFSILSAIIYFVAVKWEHQKPGVWRY